jgi:hypothetical protein
VSPVTGGLGRQHRNAAELLRMTGFTVGIVQESVKTPVIDY